MTTSSGLGSLLGKATKEMNRSSERLSSGKRVNRAADDAAGLAIIANLEAAVASLGQAERNIGAASDLIAVGDSALGQVNDIAMRMKELATQSSNGTYSDDQRAALKAEYDALGAELNRIGGSTEYNGVKVLAGQSIEAQVGIDASADSRISVGGVNLNNLAAGVTGANIGTQGGAQSALGQIDSFITNIAAKRGELGATASRLEVVQKQTGVAMENKAAAAARIRDVDLAAETANLTRNRILTQSATAMNAQAGKLVAGRVLSLLK